MKANAYSLLLFERGYESLRWTGVALGSMRAALGGEVREISHFT